MGDISVSSWQIRWDGVKRVLGQDFLGSMCLPGELW
jgi:hypothetical protein